MVLALGYILIGFNGIEPFKNVAPSMRAAAHRALTLNPSDPQPQFLLGSFAAANDYDWSEAAERFRAAMEAPNVSADARWAYASLYLSPMGRLDESAAEMGRAVEQDPLNGVWRAIWSAHLTNLGQIDRAIEEAQKAIELDEGHFMPHFVLGEAYLAAGRVEDAAAEFEKAHHAAPWHAIASGLLAGSLYRLGDTARSAEVLRQMGDDSASSLGTRAVSPPECGIRRCC